MINIITMNFIKKTICATAAMLALSAYSIDAKAIKTPELTNAETAAMANTSVVVNNEHELLTNPALMEYGGTKLSLPGLNLRLNNPANSAELIEQYQEFFKNINSSKKSLDSALLDSWREDSLVAGLSIVPSFQLSTSIGTFGIAGYGVNETSVSTNKEAIRNVVRLNEFVEDVNDGTLLESIKSGNTPENKLFMIDKPISVLSISDAGAALGYAKKFEIEDILDVSAGVTFRVFERVMIDFGPSAELAVNLDGIRADPSSIESNEDLEELLNPSLDLKSNLDLNPEIVTGLGTAVDFGLIVSKKFWIMDVMLGASIKNAPANKIEYSDGSSEMDAFQYNLGLASHPLLDYPVLNGLLLAVEMHGIEGNQSYHVGALWKFGDSIYVAPKVGFQVGKFDPLGNYQDINTFTAGADINLVVVKLSANYMLDTNDNYQVGLGLTFGYEADDD